MADSWEDHDDVHMPPAHPQQTAATRLNPNAAAFTFNPGASSFVPNFPAPPAGPPPGFPTAQFQQQQPAVPPPRPPPGRPPVASPVPPPAEVAAEHPAPSPPQVEAATPSASMNGQANGVQSMETEDAVQQQPVAPAAEPAEEATVDSAAAALDAMALEEEEETDVEAERAKVMELLAQEDQREHLNVVFIGHVDAGKSTTGGQILYLTGGVDERTIEKYEKEAKDKNRESWYMAYIMDTNEEERAKGKTVEVGRAHFETKNRRYTILDAPGHKNYVPNMIGGAAQADVGVLVISARKGEFEAGFDKGGQTREHAQLAKTLGVSKLVVVINKMDEPSIAGPNGEWVKQRYDEIITKLTPFLRSCGYNPKKDLEFLPISGLHGTNIRDPVKKEVCDWWTGKTLFEVLDSVEPPARDPMEPFRMPIIDKYKDMGTIIMGKSEAGNVKKGDNLLIMPNRVPVKVITVYRDDTEVNIARAGENLRLRVQGIEDEDINSGFVACGRKNPVRAVTQFEAQLQVLELLEHKPIFSEGYKAVLHVHSVVEECEVTKIVAHIDLKTKEKKKAKFVKSNSVAIARIGVEKAICVEPFDRVPQLGRFTIRDEGRTIAIGRIEKLPPTKEAA